MFDDLVEKLGCVEDGLERTSCALGLYVGCGALVRSRCYRGGGPLLVGSVSGHGGRLKQTTHFVRHLSIVAGMFPALGVLNVGLEVKHLSHRRRQ